MVNWGALIDEYGPLVVRISWRILGRASDVEDNVQDVFLEAYRLQREGTIRHWGGLLRRLATLGALRRLRRRRNETSLAGVMPIDRGELPEEHAIRRELEAPPRAAVLPGERLSLLFTTIAVAAGPEHARLMEAIGMTRFPLVFCSLVVTMVLSASPAGRGQTTPGAADPLAANAALSYWRAFAVLPDLNKAQDKALETAIAGMPTDEHQLAEVVRLSEPALRELHRGAAQPRCAWGTPVEDGIFTLLPHAGKARVLGRFALARAHWNFQHARPAKGVDDLIAAMTLARQVGGDAVLVTLLVDYAIERQATHLAAVDLQRMSPADLKQFAARLDRLPPTITMHEAVLAEKRVYLDFLVREVSKPGGKETLLKAAPNPDDPSFKLIRDMSEEQLREGLIGAQPLYDKIAAMTQLPSSEVKKAEQRLLADPNLKGPTRTIAQFCLPAIVPITQNEAAHKLRLALLQAAIAVQQQGPEALSNAARQDPLAKAAFRYEKADGGFRLQSKTANPRTGKPIALETGKGLSE